MLLEQWRSGVSHNPLSKRVNRAPYPYYKVLREKDPVHWSVLMNAWVVSRYQDIEKIFKDPHTFSNDPEKRGEKTTLTDVADASSTKSRAILFVDPPDHTRLRALVNRAFTPKAIEALRPRIEDIMETLLDRIPDPSHFDVTKSIATHLPVSVLAELLGIPKRDMLEVKHWATARARVLEPVMSKAEQRQAHVAGDKLDEFHRTLIHARSKAPGDDFVSRLVLAEEEGHKLSKDELLTMLRLLFTAGNHTSKNLIDNGLLALLRHPEQMHALREDPSLMPSALNECLRYDSPIKSVLRVALHDVVIGGREIKKGESLVLMLGAANHDPAVYTNPEKFDITRNEAKHLAFGRGIHHCLGGMLAPMEGAVAWEKLLQRFPYMQCASQDLPYETSMIMRTVKCLPVTTTSH